MVTDGEQFAIIDSPQGGRSTGTVLRGRNEWLVLVLKAPQPSWALAE